MKNMLSILVALAILFLGVSLISFLPIMTVYKIMISCALGGFLGGISPIIK